MIFTSFVFLLFAAVFLPVFFLVRGRAQRLVTLVASYFFYGWWDWRFMALLATSTVVDYTLGRLIAATEDERRRRLLVGASVAANLGYLGFFKYCNFFAASLTAALVHFGMTPDWASLHIVLPAGISFYTFQSMSYTIDVYRRRIPAERDFLTFATFISLFPQLVAGPIVRARWLLPQIVRTQRFRWSNFFIGLELAIIGYFLKMVIADNLASYVSASFGAPYEFGALALTLSVVFFAFQIYGDFAGYSLIAIGLARMMGYKFPANFRRPYFAQSFSEFWTRWHISLSTWLRDYLYIPLGGNRHGARKTYRNLMATMLLGGLWHGANWTFVVWGGLHGLYLVAQRLFGRHLPQQIPEALRRLPSILLVFTLVSVGWVFFRADSFAYAAAILERIATAGGWSFADVPFKFTVLKGLALIALLVSAELVAEHRALAMAYRRRRWARSGVALVLLWLIPLAGAFTGAQFIYFRF
jgi:D-alanyl-lipoteichoic acid acyltransferase DltB (MBOAT superfamily)